MRKVLALLLIVGFSAPAFAGDLRESISAEVMKAAQASASSKVSDNQYLWPSVALMGGGALMSLYGFLRGTGAEVNVTTSPTGGSISAKQTHNTGLGIAGLAVSGLGAYLLWKGGQKHSPSISFGPGSVKVQKSFSF